MVLASNWLRTGFGLVSAATEKPTLGAAIPAGGKMLGPELLPLSTRVGVGEWTLAPLPPKMAWARGGPLGRPEGGRGVGPRRAMV